MGFDKKDIINVLNTSVRQLQQGIEAHCCLISSIIEERVDERNLQPLLELCPKRSRELKLEAAIKEAIDVIEESRKSFKSKKLEALRKKLTQVLIDTE
jgi:hypothetical protein